VPILRPGDIVVMDNLSSHKSPDIRRVIRAAGAKLIFLPPYSPDLNPIEQVFANSKPCCAKRLPEPSKRPAPQSGRNAATTSSIQGTYEHKHIRL
jgi:transposase InsO family protein